ATTTTCHCRGGAPADATRLTSLPSDTRPAPPFLFFLLLLRPPPRSTLFPYTTLFRSTGGTPGRGARGGRGDSERGLLPARGWPLAHDDDHLLQRGTRLLLGRRHGRLRLEHERRPRQVPEDLAPCRESADRDPLVQGRR